MCARERACVRAFMRSCVCVCVCVCVLFVCGCVGAWARARASWGVVVFMFLITFVLVFVFTKDVLLNPTDKIAALLNCITQPNLSFFLFHSVS